MPKTDLYFDDEDEGLARETSHPNFVALAGDDFYYDCADDFSPFGSDDGNDALRGLQDWYGENKSGRGIVKFMNEFLADWGLDVPWDRIRHDLDARTQWLDEDDMHERFFQGECRAIVATAFGQLKIAGRIDAELLGLAKAAIADQLWLNARARTKYPNWEYADQEQARLEQILAVLNQPSVG